MLAVSPLLAEVWEELQPEVAQRSGLARLKIIRSSRRSSGAPPSALRAGSVNVEADSPSLVCPLPYDF